MQVVVGMSGGGISFSSIPVKKQDMMLWCYHADLAG